MKIFISIADSKKKESILNILLANQFFIILKNKGSISLFQN